MNRAFILIAGLLSALLVITGMTVVGYRSIERVRTRHESQFRMGLALELTLVTKTLRKDLVFGNLRVVRGSLAELSEGGIFSGFSVRREGLVVLDSNVPVDLSRSFVTTVPVAFGEKPGAESRWGEVIYYTPQSRFDALSAGFKDELVLSVVVAALVTLAVICGLFLLLSGSIGLLVPKLTIVVLQEELPPSGKLARFIWGPAIAQLEALSSKLTQRRHEVEQARSAAMHTRIAQNIVHDLRTPLGAFERGLDVKDWHSFEKIRPLMHRALARLHAMVEALRHSELERLVRPEPTSLSFAQVLDELLPFAAEHQIDLQGPADAISCVVDQPKVERAVLNLLRNAIEAGRGKVSLNVSCKGEGLIITVEDDGDGVPPALVGQLFRRGWTHAKAGGSGLGLAYARDVARGHGGELSYFRNDHWTLFQLELPDVLLPSGTPQPFHLPPAEQRSSQSEVLLALLEDGMLLPAVQDAWQGPVLSVAPSGVLDVAAVYVAPSRFDEVAERISAGVPVIFAKVADEPSLVIAQLAKRAKKGLS